MRPLLTLAALLGPLLACPAAKAAVLTYHGTFSVTTSGGASAAQIALGDVFYYEFKVNTSVADTNASTSYATFPGLFLDYRLGRASTNTGTWNPAASGIWSASATGHADFGQLRTIFNGSGFQSVQVTSMMPGPMGGTQNVTTPLVNPSFNMPFTDNGSGQTFEQMFGAITPTSVIPYFFMGNNQVGTSSVSFGAGAHPMLVPEPSGVLLFGCGMLTVALRRRRAA